MLLANFNGKEHLRIALFPCGSTAFLSTSDFVAGGHFDAM